MNNVEYYDIFHSGSQPHSPLPHSIEYNVSYIYHALSAYFDRDTVHLPNIAKFFRENSIEERDHA